MTLEEARALFPVLETVAYLNAGTFGPLAEPVARAQQEALARDLAHGRSGLPYFDEAMALRAELRAQFASLVGAEVDQVALTGSTTDGCGIVLRGLGLGPGDEIVTTTDEHFGLLGGRAVRGLHADLEVAGDEAGFGGIAVDGGLRLAVALQRQAGAAAGDQQRTERQAGDGELMPHAQSSGPGW